MDNLIKLVNQGFWAEARVLANKMKAKGENSDTFWVLNSTIYKAESNSQGEFFCITLGLAQNPYNYELYYMLGEYYASKNINQASICMEQALYYCDKEEDYSFINSRLQEIRATDSYTQRNTSILIVTHNNVEEIKECLSNIRKTIPSDSYEIIIVDNGSNADTVDFLSKQEHIKLICNNTLMEYSKCYNIGIRHASTANDILILHSDTIITPNSFMWLKMGLYENENVGASGAITNIGENNQSINLTFDTINQYNQYALKNNIPSINPYEKKIWLSNFCILLSRNAIDNAGPFDENFSLYNYCMADYGVLLSSKGYEMNFCHNAFVYHHCNCHEISSLGSIDELTQSCNDYLSSKWGFNITYYLNLRYELIGCISEKPNEPISILEVGCGCGTTLSKIKYLYPNSKIYGIELIDNVAKIGHSIANIVSGNIESMELDYESNSLDYVIFGDVLEHLRDPASVITSLKKYLKPKGKIIASIPNLMHLSVIIPLLQGDFTYTDEGLLDRTHIHFFTKNEITKMFNECGYAIKDMSSMTNLGGKEFIKKHQSLVNQLYKLPGIAPKVDFETFQFLVVAEKTN